MVSFGLYYCISKVVSCINCWINKAALWQNANRAALAKGLQPCTRAVCCPTLQFCDKLACSFLLAIDRVAYESIQAQMCLLISPATCPISQVRLSRDGCRACLVGCIFAVSKIQLCATLLASCMVD